MINPLVNNTNISSNTSSNISGAIKYTAVVYAVFATIFGGLGCYIISRWKIENPQKVIPV